MKDTETVTLDDFFKNILGYQQGNDGSWWTNDWIDNQTDAVNEAKAAIIKLFEQVIGEDEEDDGDPYDINAQRNNVRAEQRQRLQALSNSGKQHIDRGTGFTHSDSNDCACFSLDAKEDLL